MSAEIGIVLALAAYVVAALAYGLFADWIVEHVLWRWMTDAQKAAYLAPRVALAMAMLRDAFRDASVSATKASASLAAFVKAYARFSPGAS